MKGCTGACIGACVCGINTRQGVRGGALRVVVLVSGLVRVVVLMLSYIIIYSSRCPGITRILDALNIIARFSPSAERSREDITIDNLFIFPKGDAPKAIYTLYLLAWRYIITDFYRIHYENIDIDYSEESILIRIIERYTALRKALIFAYETDSARTAQAGMGRQPKKRIDIGDFRPVFHISDKGGLKPSEEIAELATKLRIAHAVEETEERGNEDE